MNAARGWVVDLRRPPDGGVHREGSGSGGGCPVSVHWREQTRDAFDKLPRGLDRLTRALFRHMRTGAGFVIGNGFKLVGAGKERPQVGVNARIVFHLPRKFSLDA
jgi:hypothetical protein